MSCTDERNCLEDEVTCKITSISCVVNDYECIGRPVNKLNSSLIRLQNIKYIIDNLICELTCEEVEAFRCIVKKIKS